MISNIKEVYILQNETFQLTEIQFLIRLLIATGIGFVLGLERQFNQNKKDEIFAGVRTFTLISLIGFVSALLSFVLTTWVFIAGMLSIILFVGISYWVTANRGDIGGTSEFTAILTFLLGALTLLGFTSVSISLTVIVVVILSLKMQLTTIIGKITKEEFSAFVSFVVIALLILPFLPNQNFGPYNVINPREIGWVIVLTSGIGFFGYILMKFLGTNIGVLLTGIVGGMVSSTVVTYTFAKKSKVAPALSGKFAVAIFAAAAVMIVRVLIWVFIFNRSMFPKMIIPLSIVLLTALCVALFLYKSSNSKVVSEQLPLGEPINIKDAFIFGVVYTGILILVSYANSEYGTKGIYLSSVISALTDIDAITISVSKLAGDSIQILTAQNAILIATLSNTIVKIGIALTLGSKALRKYIIAGYGIIFIAGIVGFIVINI